MGSEFGKKILELAGSKRYRDAISRIGSWAQKLEHAGKAETIRILGEKKAYFIRMRRDRPGLYSMLEGEDKALGEKIYQKLSGNAAVLEALGP